MATSTLPSFVQDIIDNSVAAFLKLEKTKIDSLQHALDVDVFEHSAMQNKQASLRAEGFLCLEDAQLLYSTLGNSPSHFNKQPLAVKYAIMEIFAALLKNS